MKCVIHCERQQWPNSVYRCALGTLYYTMFSVRSFSLSKVRKLNMYLLHDLTYKRCPVYGTKLLVGLRYQRIYLCCTSSESNFQINDYIQKFLGDYSFDFWVYPLYGKQEANIFLRNSCVSSAKFHKDSDFDLKVDHKLEMCNHQSSIENIYLR